MLLTGTFLDEISHDIPHQNWGPREWDADFGHMKAAGLDTVIVIRCGYRRALTYPSPYLLRQGCHEPEVDLIELFLTLAEKHGLNFYFGLYDSGRAWDTGDLSNEADVNAFVTEEAWERYGHHRAFRGWYLSAEISRNTPGAVRALNLMGTRCKQVSGGLPVFLSPWMDGSKAVPAASAVLRKEGIQLEVHEREWDEILGGLAGAVDAVAFQDGHVDDVELESFLRTNKKLADRYGLQCWTNAESFDRDMPIKFLPIKWEKLRRKLEAAGRAGYDKAITFEFSHFLSPQSAYVQAHHLYNRYQEYRARRLG
ncbi:MAG: DUF4434 domain-containing protein [Spirochaetales bacterium]